VASTAIKGRLEAAAQECIGRLREDALAGAVRALGPLAEPERAFRLLSKITLRPESGHEAARICKSGGYSNHEMERALLLTASLHAIPRVPALPVSETVKNLFADEFNFFASPPPVWEPHFGIGDLRYREMARVATLRRFPAGQFHWEVSSFPRSWLLKARRPVALLRHIQSRMGGFGPVLELHVNERRRNRIVLLEREANLSYARAARALREQPGMRGFMMASWFFCKTTAQVSPRLAWLRTIPEAAGAGAFDLGPAPESSGFLVGSEERRKLYEEGSYRPRMTCVLWPREQVIAWAEGRPEE
jgi:hypothetical protein